MILKQFVEHELCNSSLPQWLWCNARSDKRDCGSVGRAPLRACVVLNMSPHTYLFSLLVLREGPWSKMAVY